MLEKNYKIKIGQRFFAKELLTCASNKLLAVPPVSMVVTGDYERFITVRVHFHADGFDDFDYEESIFKNELTPEMFKPGYGSRIAADDVKGQRIFARAN